MFHLLFALQEIATYKNVIKCKKDKSLDKYDFTNDRFLLYNLCSSDAKNTYCFGECDATSNKCPEASVATVTETDLIFPVEDQFIIQFNLSSSATPVIDAIDDELCYKGKIALNSVAGEKKTFYLITCIMFWVAFLLIVGTFVLALISIANCGCCRCCNSVKSIFPMKSTVGSA